MPRRRARLVPVTELIHRARPGADAEALIAARRVHVDGVVVTNIRSRVPVDAAVRLLPVRRLRGTEKLEAALRCFDVRVRGRAAVDVGAAAGGFTSALLAAGARRVYAVDAGHGQLLGRLRQDPRVVDLEGVNLAELDTALVPERVELLVGDLSYLPVRRAVGQLERLCFAPGAELLWLVKPTFELGLAAPTTDRHVLTAALRSATSGIATTPWQVVATAASRVRGRRGTVEAFVYARRG